MEIRRIVVVAWVVVAAGLLQTSPAAADHGNEPTCEGYSATGAPEDGPVSGPTHESIDEPLWDNRGTQGVGIAWFAAHTTSCNVAEAEDLLEL